MKSLLSSSFLTLALASLALVPAHAATQGPIDISAQKLEVNQSSSKAVFSGNVVVTQQGLTLTAPTVTADYASQGGNSGIQTVTASGGVVITRTGAGGITEKATGSTAVYNPEAGNLTLIGAVTLVRGPSELSGDKLVYNLTTGNAVVTNSAGPVKARFVPGGK